MPFCFSGMITLFQRGWKRYKERRKVRVYMYVCLCVCVCACVCVCVCERERERERERGEREREMVRLNRERNGQNDKLETVDLTDSLPDFFYRGHFVWYQMGIGVWAHGEHQIEGKAEVSCVNLMKITVKPISKTAENIWCRVCFQCFLAHLPILFWLCCFICSFLFKKKKKKKRKEKKQSKKSLA